MCRCLFEYRTSLANVLSCACVELSSRTAFDICSAGGKLEHHLLITNFYYFYYLYFYSHCKQFLTRDYSCCRSKRMCPRQLVLRNRKLIITRAAIMLHCNFIQKRRIRHSNYITYTLLHVIFACAANLTATWLPIRASACLMCMCSRCASNSSKLERI